MNAPEVSVRAWGNYALFTRPELKVERYTYDMLTPSAAKGILEAIFYRPQFRWKITKISVLKGKRGRTISVMRNEVKEKASLPTAKSLPSPIVADGNKDLLGTDQKGRTPRTSLILADVDYIIDARIEQVSKTRHDDGPRAWEEMFLKRIRLGKCFHRPSFGCREFVANFGEVTTKHRDALESDWTEDLGPMLLDIDYGDDRRGWRREAGILDPFTEEELETVPAGKSKARTPRFFEARVEAGVMQVEGARILGTSDEYL